MIRGSVGIASGMLLFLAVSAWASATPGRIGRCQKRPELLSCQRFADRKVSRLRDFERRIVLGGEPLAYARGDDGSLMVLVEYDREGTPSCPTQTEDRVRDRVLVKAFPDGRLSAVD